MSGSFYYEMILNYFLSLGYFKHLLRFLLLFSPRNSIVVIYPTMRDSERIIFPAQCALYSQGGTYSGGRSGFGVP